MVATPSLHPGSKLTLPLGLWLFMSRHIVEATRAYVAAGGVRSLKQGVLLGDLSCKFCRNGFCSGSLGSGCAAFFFFQGHFYIYPRARPSSAAYQWAPQDNRSAVAPGLVRMITVYLKVFNIDLTTWFLAVTLDGYAAGQAIVEMVFRPGTLLGRDLPHLERNVLKHFPHVDDTRSQPNGRRPRF